MVHALRARLPADWVIATSSLTRGEWERECVGELTIDMFPAFCDLHGRSVLLSLAEKPAPRWLVACTQQAWSVPKLCVTANIADKMKATSHYTCKSWCRVGTDTQHSIMLHGRGNHGRCRTLGPCQKSWQQRSCTKPPDAKCEWEPPSRNIVCC
jgi:hypothetical protein